MATWTGPRYPAVTWERCTPELLREHPAICNENRRIVGERSDGTCDYHEHPVPRPFWFGGHCADCGLSASRCDCGERCLCGAGYRPMRGEKPCHKLVEA